VQVCIDAVEQAADHPEIFLLNELHVDEDEWQVISEPRQKTPAAPPSMTAPCRGR